LQLFVDGRFDEAAEAEELGFDGEGVGAAAMGFAGRFDADFLR
jgi:hypothetical protein